MVPIRRSLALLLCAAGLACTGEQVLLPTTPPTVAGATWYLHAVNDTTLPATVSARGIGVVLEQIVLDSAAITIDTTGRWEQRAWMRVFLSGVLDRTETLVDHGTWITAGGASTLTSTVRAPRTIALVALDATTVRTTERFPSHLTAPLTTGTYRRTRP
jgi:hypothetical protein